MQEYLTLLLCTTTLIGINYVSSFGILPTIGKWQLTQTNTIQVRKVIPNKIFTTVLQMSTEEATIETKEGEPKAEKTSTVKKLIKRKSEIKSSKPGATKSKKVDYKKFTVGQELTGKIVDVKNFGVFVNYNGTVDMLLPKSITSRGTYEKLKRLHLLGSTEEIKFEIVTVSVENKTISARYVSPSGQREKVQFDALESYRGKELNATVVSIHDFGLIVEPEDLLLEGLIPRSKMPNKLTQDVMQALYPVGSTVTVMLDEVNTEKNRISFSIKNDRIDHLAILPENRWLEMVVQEVLPTGLMVRPAGYDFTVLLAQKYIPKDLLKLLHERLGDTKDKKKEKKEKKGSVASGPTEIQKLFTVGDILKARKSPPNNEGKSSLSMLRNKAERTDDDDDEEGRAPRRKKKRAEDGDEEVNEEEDDFDDELSGEDDEADKYDMESLLIWWRGSSFTKPALSEEVQPTGYDYIEENEQMVAGRWRRLMEEETRSHTPDSEDMMEENLAEIDSEIGAYDGFDQFIEEDSFFQFGSVPLISGLKAQGNLPEELKQMLAKYTESREMQRKELLDRKAIAAKFEEREKEFIARIKREQEAAAAAKRKSEDVVSERVNEDVPVEMP